MRITVDLSDNLSRALAASSARAERIVRAGLSDIADEHNTAARAKAGTGPYARSFTVVSLPGLAYESGSTSPLASVIERGRRPGRRPPARSIVKRAGGSQAAAERAADRIAQRGTRGQWIVKKANTQIKTDGTFEQIARDALAAVAALEG